MPKKWFDEEGEKVYMEEWAALVNSTQGKMITAAEKHDKMAKAMKKFFRERDGEQAETVTTLQSKDKLDNLRKKAKRIRQQSASCDKDGQPC